MSAWKGAEKYECIFALPHKTKIMRKPQGIGAELKSLADGESGILLNLEFMEGKDAQNLKEYCDIYPSSIALTLRIVKHYFGSGITLHADSAFSSVATAKALRSRGVHFMGCVKTACKAFPKSFFQQWSNDDNVLRGSHKTLKSTITLEDNVTVENVFAVGWKDKTTKQIICTRGLTSVMGNPSVRHRRRLVETDWGHENDRYDLHIPRPQAIEMFFSCFSNIDVHDHYRQGSLALEKNWNTKTWWHRLFATLFGMVCTDAFLAYRLETRNRQMGGEVGLLCYKDFLHRLAYQLIHNGGVQRRLRRRNADAINNDDEPPQVYFVIAVKCHLFY
jgi:Transposase IS4